MKRQILTLCFLLLLAAGVQARHITGGEMFYRFIRSNASGTAGVYQVTLKLYRDCNTGGAPLDGAAAITIFDASNLIVNNLQVTRDRIETQQLQYAGPCISNPPIVCYEVGYYLFEIELPYSQEGYTIAYQRCCRIENITNVSNSGNVGATYTTHIPGTNVSVDAPKNNSARFGGKDTVVVCENNPFVYDFSAVDEDGDLLQYVFCNAYLGASTNQPQPAQSAPPPFQAVPYDFGFTSFQPMGANVKINEETGIVSGIAPSAGIYVVTVCVNEFRDGKLINTQRKDLQIKVAACTIAAADLQPEYITCDGFTLTFENRSNSPLINSYSWDFGVTGVDSDTSNQARPTFTYADTGVYRIRLITNRGQECSDTAFANAKVFPGFFPDFTATPACKGVPLEFFDATRTQYGVVSKWNWNFGYPPSLPGRDSVQNPKYTYPSNGTYQVRLIVNNSKGCQDTIIKDVLVTDRPSMNVTNDTLICSIDTLQLKATGNGSFQWSPNIAINNTSIADPLVSPDNPTTYYVKLLVAPGCEAFDSVFVDVRTAVTLNAGKDTTICLTDPLTLKPASDGLKYLWSPAATLNNPNIKNPVATPTAASTTYTVTASIGKCSTKDDIIIKTVAYPKPVASPDTAICFGDTAFLRATNATQYQWLPSSIVDEPNAPNVKAYPKTSTRFIVQGFENNGCPKAGIDSVIVLVTPPIPAFAGNDTAVVLGQPLQLNATGGAYYLWTPSTGLNNPNIPDPVADLSSSQTYILKVSSEIGCFAFDTLNVKVFLTAPDIFVPTAFTPNGDGLNDVLKPIPVGITTFDYFRVYNRYGQEVFSTTLVGEGWDGSYNGKEQGNNTFVWMVQGTDFTGKVVKKKGTVTVIR